MTTHERLDRIDVLLDRLDSRLADGARVDRLDGRPDQMGSRLDESLGFRAGRIDILTQQIARLSDLVIRGFTYLADRDDLLAQRLSALEAKAAEMERGG